MKTVKTIQTKETNQFHKDLFGKSRGFVHVTSSGNKQGLILPTVKMSRNIYRDDCINHKCLKNDNKKVSFNTFIDDCELSERNLNDITTLVLKTDLPNYLSYSNQKRTACDYEQELLFSLEKMKEDNLTPTHIIVSDAVYLTYVLKDNVHVGHCKGNKKKRIIKYIKHIMYNLCKRLNTVTGDSFEPLPLTASINIPNSTYAVFKWKRDKTTNVGYSEVVSRGIANLSIPEKGRIWDSLDKLAEAASMPRYNTYRRNFNKAIKHHIKNREFFGVQGMLKRRMKLIENIMSTRKYHKDARVANRLDYLSFSNMAIFLYFNFAFELEKEYNKAFQATKNLILSLYSYIPKKDLDKLLSHLGLKQELLISGHGYKYTDEKMFEVLRITREEAAEIYGYTTADKKAYDRAYSQVRREALRNEKEKMNEARWQKMMDFRNKIINLRKEGLSYKKIAETLKTSVSTIAYHFKNHKSYMDIGMKLKDASVCPI